MSTLRYRRSRLDVCVAAIPRDFVFASLLLKESRNADSPTRPALTPAGALRLHHSIAARIASIPRALYREGGATIKRIILVLVYSETQIPFQVCMRAHACLVSVLFDKEVGGPSSSEASSGESEVRLTSLSLTESAW